MKAIIYSLHQNALCCWQWDLVMNEWINVTVRKQSVSFNWGQLTLLEFATSTEGRIIQSIRKNDLDF